MAFDISTLVTDRKQSDVVYVKQLIAKIVAGTATEPELAEWKSLTLKGAYNYTDLNRVSAAMEYLRSRLNGYGYTVPGYKRIEVPHKNASVGRLPAGYTEVAYIESSGAQYIDTGFKPKYNSRVVMDVSGLSTSGLLFGARDTNSTNAKNQFVLYRKGGTSIRSDYFGTNKTLNISDTSMRTTIDKNANVVTLYGETITNTAVSSGECTYPMYLFTLNNVGVAHPTYASYKLYSCQIYDNGTLVRDFIPCINPDGAYGLYDVVNSKFYGNAGSGAFTGGAVVDPSVEPDDDTRNPYLWYEDDIPTPAQMVQYLANVEAIRQTLAVLTTTPETPTDMEALTAQEANAIEQILVNCEQVIGAMRNIVPHAAQPLVLCGFVIYAAQQGTYPAPTGLFVYTADGFAVYTSDGYAVQVKE